MTNVTNDIRYIGVNDHELDLFEGQYIVPEGMAYNSYMILDEKIAVFDTADRHFTEQWLANVAEALGGRTPDYLIVQHMEPDHSASIAAFLEKYPDTAVVGNAKTFAMLGQFFEKLHVENKVTVKDGDSLSLGKHLLQFVFAPMVHWPEVMFTYDSTDKVLFSADAFGKFGALDAEDDDWACEARRYYFGIVGKYGMQVQNVLKKAAKLDIRTICPLHGPVLSENLGYYLDLYNTWSSYGVESEGVCIAYTSVYGNTKYAAELLAEALKGRGCPKVAITDLAREDMAEAVEDAFRYGKLVLATTTYNAEIFPFMKHFIDDLTERGYQNRTIGLIENGTWAPMAAKVMKGMFEKSKNITWLETTVTIKSAVTQENREQIAKMADELMA
ncbi:MAG: FprA family A-type flavoprotein [Oscillospiraceae bacterium]|nr:FprA family A-type flavoprotein [Oscillospiraceae bacterium]